MIERRRALAHLGDPVGDLAGQEPLLARDPATSLAAIEIGQALRETYGGPERAAQVQRVAQARNVSPELANTLVDQHTALAAARDLQKVLFNAPIDPRRAQALTNLGLLESNPRPDGTPQLRVTDDALPLFASATRRALQANPARFANTFTTTPDPTGNLWSHYVRSGVRRLSTNLARGAAPQQTSRADQSSPTPVRSALAQNPNSNDEIFREAQDQAHDSRGGPGHPGSQRRVAPQYDSRGTPEAGRVVEESSRVGSDHERSEVAESRAAADTQYGTPVQSGGSGVAPRGTRIGSDGEAASPLGPSSRHVSIAKKLRTILQRHAGLFRVSGAGLVEAEGVVGGGIAYDSESNVVMFDPDAVEAHMDLIARRGLNPDRWLEKVLAEEGFHAADVAHAGPNYENLHLRLTPLLPQDALRLAQRYTGATTADIWSLEYLRMLWQFRQDGVITEELTGKRSAAEIAEIKRVLSLPQPRKVENYLAKIESFIAASTGGGRSSPPKGGRRLGTDGPDRAATMAAVQQHLAKKLAAGVKLTPHEQAAFAQAERELGGVTQDSRDETRAPNQHEDRMPDVSPEPPTPHEPDPPVPPAPPRNDPISGKLVLRWLPAILRKAVERIVQLMDLAHDEGGLRNGSLFEQLRGIPWSSYDPITRSIKILKETNIPHYETAHELAHWIDHRNSGDADYRASQHDDSPEMEAWREAVRASNAGQKLKDASAADPQNELLKEAKRWRELWARSYAQWLALRTGDPALLRELDSMRNSSEVDLQALHWTNEDFKAIGETIDAVLRSRGWLP